MKSKHHLSRQILLTITLVVYLIHFVNAQEKHLPIIDVHVHAMKVNPNFGGDMCPWFLKNMPGGDPNQPPPNFINLDCAEPLKAAKTDQEFQDALVATMKRLNMTIVASGDASVIKKWSRAMPGRVIPSLGFGMDSKMTAKAFADSLSGGFYKVVGEVAPQYQGMSPSDPSLDEYFAAAEKLNLPVGVHMVLPG